MAVTPHVVGRVDFNVDPLPRAPNNTRYAVQVKSGIAVMTVALIHVTNKLSITIQEQMRRKCMDFVEQKYGKQPMNILVAGRVDFEIT